METSKIRKEAAILFNDQQLEWGRFDGWIYDPQDPSSKLNAEFRAYFFILSDLELTLSPTDYKEEVDGSDVIFALENDQGLDEL